MKKPSLHHPVGPFQHHRDGDHSLAQGEESHPRVDVAEAAAALPVAFRKQTYHGALVEHIECAPDGLAIGLTAVDGKGPQSVDNTAERSHLPQLGLGHEMDLPVHGYTQEEGIEVRAMVRSQENGSLKGNILAATDLHAEEGLPGRRDQQVGDPPKEGVQRAAHQATQRPLAGVASDAARSDTARAAGAAFGGGRCSRRGRCDRGGRRADRPHYLFDRESCGVDLDGVVGLAQRSQFASRIVGVTADDVRHQLFQRIAPLPSPPTAVGVAGRVPPRRR